MSRIIHGHFQFHVRHESANQGVRSEKRAKSQDQRDVEFTSWLSKFQEACWWECHLGMSSQLGQSLERRDSKSMRCTADPNLICRDSSLGVEFRLGRHIDKYRDNEPRKPATNKRNHSSRHGFRSAKRRRSSSERDQWPCERSVEITIRADEGVRVD